MSDGKGEAGKGDRYRKLDLNKYGKNYDRIFGKMRCKDCGRPVRFVPEHIPQKGNTNPCGKVVL